MARARPSGRTWCPCRPCTWHHRRPGRRGCQRCPQALSSRCAWSSWWRCRPMARARPSGRTWCPCRPCTWHHRRPGRRGCQRCPKPCRAAAPGRSGGGAGRCPGPPERPHLVPMPALHVAPAAARPARLPAMPPSPFEPLRLVELVAVLAGVPGPAPSGRTWCPCRPCTWHHRRPGRYCCQRCPQALSNRCARSSWWRCWPVPGPARAAAPVAHAGPARGTTAGRVGTVASDAPKPRRSAAPGRTGGGAGRWPGPARPSGRTGCPCRPYTWHNRRPGQCCCRRCPQALSSRCAWSSWRRCRPTACVRLIQCACSLDLSDSPKPARRSRLVSCRPGPRHRPAGLALTDWGHSWGHFQKEASRRPAQMLDFRVSFGCLRPSK